MQFSQPNIALALVGALVKRKGTPEFSARVLAQDVAGEFTDVPLPVLRILADKVLALFFEPISPEDCDAARLNASEMQDVAVFLGDAYREAVADLKSRNAAARAN